MQDYDGALLIPGRLIIGRTKAFTPKAGASDFRCHSRS